MMHEHQSNYSQKGKPMSLKDDFCSRPDIFILSSITAKLF